MAKLTDGDILSSNNYGDFRVISDEGPRSVRIEFIKTGYRSVIRRRDARRGSARDPFYPSVSGVGFVGEGGRGNKAAYFVWKHMIERCYDANALAHDPSYAGCTVVRDWHNFQNFKKWYEENHKTGLQIDKDILIEGNRVYGPDTCLFVTPKENSIKANAKNYVFLSPDNVRHEIYNMTQFSKENGLDQRHMSGVNTGRRNHHRGWTKA